jgi:hypothetical protein
MLYQQIQLERRGAGSAVETVRSFSVDAQDCIALDLMLRCDDPLYVGLGHGLEGAGNGLGYWDVVIRLVSGMLAPDS